jgi:hypothetical protein
MSEKIVDRVRKLLELANSANEHEAALAAARAAELMTEHQISEAEIAVKRGQAESAVEACADELIDGDEEGRSVTWRYWIVDGIAESLGGDVYRGLGSELHAVVPASAMPTVRYMFAYLTREVERLANEAYAEEVRECAGSWCVPPGARAWKTAFRAGAAVKIRARLIEQRKATIQTHRQASRTLVMGAADKCQALVIVDRQSEAVVAHVRKAAPWKFTKSGKERGGRSVSCGSSSRSGFDAGRSAGERVQLGGGKALESGAKRLRG